jgi:hypothetical protein
VKPDERSFRIALVADRYVNPPPGGLDALAVLAEAGWGAMQLPADDYPAEIAARVLAEVTEQAEEFGRHGYDFVLVGDRDGLAEALAAAGLGVPDQTRAIRRRRAARLPEGPARPCREYLVLAEHGWQGPVSPRSLLSGASCTRTSPATADRG